MKILVNVALAALLLVSTMAFAETRKFNLYTVQASGVKMWVPSTIVVNEGDDVELTLKSKLGKGSIHGFTIDAFKVVETVDDKGKTIKFKADKSGIFNFRCHLHATHVGGQLVVLD